MFFENVMIFWENGNTGDAGRSGDAQIPKGIIFIKVNTYKEIFLN